MKQKKFLIGGIIIFLAIGYLAYTGFQSSATYYYTINELLAQKNTIQSSNVRVTGQVASDSVETETATLTMKFTITDGPSSLPVVYKGAVPDTFKAGIDVVVEGRLEKDGVFRASTILTKCPSKYEPAGSS
ncbi:MAG: cytochrome c maturation protein CcmE [Chloroflexota bacterium]